MLVVSSKEALEVVGLVQSALARHGLEADAWSEIFRPGIGYLETLVNCCGYYDAVVAVFAADDTARIRDREVAVTRDNVIFEFGMFLGRLGPKRTFFLLEDGVELFSDWAGITIARYSRDGRLPDDVTAACRRFRAVLASSSAAAQFTRQPATALAHEYHRNYLSRLFTAFEECDSYVLHDRAAGGRAGPPVEQPIRDHYPRVTVMLPHSLKALGSTRHARVTAEYSRAVLSSRAGEVSAFVRAGADGEPTFFDVPTVLRALEPAIEQAFTQGFLDQDDRRRPHVEAREIAVWKSAVEHLSGRSVLFGEWG